MLTRIAGLAAVATNVLVPSWPALAGDHPKPIVVSQDNNGGVVDTTDGGVASTANESVVAGKSFEFVPRPLSDNACAAPSDHDVCGVITAVTSFAQETDALPMLPEVVKLP